MQVERFLCLTGDGVDIQRAHEQAPCEAASHRKSRNSAGQRDELVVELDGILRRKHTDVAVVADDILYIPENKGRKLSVAALEKVLLFGSTAGATALVYSNR